MFIAPQHFQQADLALRTYIHELAQLDLTGADFGLTELVINEEHLQAGKVSVSRAAGVFPDRTFFRLSEELVFDIPDGTVETLIYLVLPLARMGATQVGEQPGVHRFLSSRLTLQDISNANNDPLDAEVASVGVCLALHGKDMSGFSAIPFARVLEKTGEGRVVLDRSFIAPCIAIQGSSILRERLDEIISLARGRCNLAASRIAAAQGTQSPTSLLEERFELQGLNRAVLKLQGISAHPMASGRTLYGELAQMLVTLEAARAEVTDPGLIYDPINPTKCFGDLFARLRKKLTLESEASVVALKWNTELFEKRRLLRMVVPPRLIAEARRPILAISGGESAAFLSGTVPLACKLAGISAMPELVQRGLNGVGLRALSVAPTELRDRADAAFFAIDTGSAHWQRFIEKREALALHVDDRIRSLDATLYMVG